MRDSGHMQRLVMVLALPALVAGTARAETPQEKAWQAARKCLSTLACVSSARGSELPPRVGDPESLGPAIEVVEVQAPPLHVHDPGGVTELSPSYRSGSPRR